MPFKVAARTLLHLGAELISSDAVALYELIKNAFDANSRRGVFIDVVVRLRDFPEELRTHVAELDDDEQPKRATKEEERRLLDMKEHILAGINQTAPEAEELADAVRSAESREELRELVRDANSITVRDHGHGMSFSELRDVYLTIGTRSRLKEREGHQGERPILGEKGLGRLAVMRLGQKVSIRTARSEDQSWNKLDIDWTWFSHASDALIESVEIAPHRGARKDESNQSGTEIRITDLNGNWTEEKLNKIAREDISKIYDPFSDKRRYPIILSFNGGDAISVPSLDRDVFEYAHATIEANFNVEGTRFAPKLSLVGRMVSNEYHREKTFELGVSELIDATAKMPDVLWSLGSFTVKAYWYNRQLLRKQGDHERQIAEYISAWSGGLMLFRDGFRVYPYGGPDDDWLDLDKKALASGGYKLNRRQFLGKVDITSRGNPYLNDQSNREGLRNSPEKEALVSILQSLLQVHLKAFMDRAKKEVDPKLQVSINTLGARVEHESQNVRKSLALLRRHLGELPARETDLLDNISESVNVMVRTMKEVERIGENFETELEQLTHLAGLGLLVEMLAHELGRATAHTLDAVLSAKRQAKTGLPTSLTALEGQLTTLHKRLRTLDPATTSGRQTKEQFDLVELVGSIVEGHREEMRRHGIQHEVVTVLEGVRFEVKMVKGMIIQILENLLTNSLYWVKQHKKLHPRFTPKIVVTVDARRRQLRVHDNGPGVAVSMAEDVFQAFFTTKPADEGKGLGLYVSRELARYHKATLTISGDPPEHDGRLNTFVLSIP